MDKKSQIVLVLGIVITLLLYFIFDIYLAGIFFVLAITLFMSMQIMRDSTYLPEVGANLADDAKSIILKNTGNSTALQIHVALVPMNTEYDVPFLAVDETHTFPLDSMIEEVKAVVTFQNEKKGGFSQTYALSALGNEFDPLKPVIPMFKWK